MRLTNTLHTFFLASCPLQLLGDPEFQLLVVPQRHQTNRNEFLNAGLALQHLQTSTDSPTRAHDELGAVRKHRSSKKVSNYGVHYGYIECIYDICMYLCISKRKMVETSSQWHGMNWCPTHLEASKIWAKRRCDLLKQDMKWWNLRWNWPVPCRVTPRCRKQIVAIREYDL